MEAIRSSETDLHKIYTRHIPEDGILHSHRRENLKYYEVSFGLKTEHITIHAIVFLWQGGSKQNCGGDMQNFECSYMNHEEIHHTVQYGRRHAIDVDNHI
jgi:hypothetical protein